MEDFIGSLWGSEFDIKDTQKSTKTLIQKVKQSEHTVQPTSEIDADRLIKSKSVGLDKKLELVRNEVNRTLSKQRNNVIVIKTLNDLHQYLVEGLKFGRVDIDTETNNSLDPITCKLMGLCLYVKGQKQAYVPVNHINRDSGQRLSYQLTEQDIHNELLWLLQNKGSCQFVFHNGKFDYEVLKCTCKVEVPIDWDTLIGSKLLDENEPAGLKYQYVNKIDPEQAEYKIEELFEHLPYEVVDPELFALYAATDAMMTDKLYEYQQAEFAKPENVKLLSLAKELEMPLVRVLGELEMAGMEVDLKYSARLSSKYHNMLDEIDRNIESELNKMSDKIQAWRLTEEANYKPLKGGKPSKSKSEQLTTPINLASPTQLAILLYDVLGVPAVNREKPRATGEEELTKLSEKLDLPILKLLVTRRGVVKLLTTYIDRIPELSELQGDHRVRTHFNQDGAATGRLSSSKPINFQNIPSGNKEIRLMFRAGKGHKIVGSDFSAQEPRLAAFYTQDKEMIRAYQEGRDLYAVVASLSFNQPYEDCLEFYPEGTKISLNGKEVVCGYKTHKNEKGKERRTQAKSILLGLLYGRGAASVAEQIHKTKEEAQELINKFFKAFPVVKTWIDQTIANAKKTGYVEDVAGRKRRLPDILLEPYTFKDLREGRSENFNPLLICQNRQLDSDVVDHYRKKLSKPINKAAFDKIEKEALQEGVKITNNIGLISQAERQAVNARVQGGASTLTKRALLNIFNNKELRELGAYLISTVHDEVLMEVPSENAEKCAKLLVETMIDSAKYYVSNVPMSCDAYIVDHWYQDEYEALLQDEFNDLKKKFGGNEKACVEAYNYMAQRRTEIDKEQLKSILEPVWPSVVEQE